MHTFATLRQVGFAAVFDYFFGFEFFLLSNIFLARPSAMLRERKPLVRQAKFGVSCRVKDPVEQGLTNHSYRVLQ